MTNPQEELNRILTTKQWFLAIKHRNLDLIQIFIDNKFDVDTIHYHKAILYYKHGYTALMFAVENHNKILVKMLIDAGANLDIQENRKYTALMFATQRNYKKIITMLINAGADVNKQDSNLQTALMFSILKYDNATIQMILNAGADNSIKDYTGRTAQEIAQAYYDSSMFNKLIDTVKTLSI